MITNYPNRDLSAILTRLFPDGGWSTRDSEIVTIPAGAPMPTEEELALTHAEYLVDSAIPAPVEISKLTLMRRLDALGKWPAFKELLLQLPEITQDAWALAQSIRSDDPLFVEAAPAIKGALSLTDEQFDGLLLPE